MPRHDRLPTRLVHRSGRDPLQLRWLSARAFTNSWYPQGIDVGTWRGRQLLAVSWFRTNRSRAHIASRVTLMDPSRPRAIDIALAVERDGALFPARIHTGGLAWFGDRLFAAATGRGIWEFDLSRTRSVSGTEARLLTGSTRKRHPKSAVVAVRTAAYPVALRCSFIGRIVERTGEASDRVLIGEHRQDESGRIGEFAIPQGVGERFVQHTQMTPGIASMQGAVRWGDDLLISQSVGKRPGVLWQGKPGETARQPTPLPPGCEDLALDPDRGVLWTLGEHPWRRVVYGIPLRALKQP